MCLDYMVFGWLCAVAVVRGNDFERAGALVGADVNDLVVDAVLCHSGLCMQTVVGLRSMFAVDVLAGSILGGDGVKLLNEAETDGLHCGISNGSMIYKYNKIKYKFKFIII